jgi:hypothetical protein
MSFERRIAQNLFFRFWRPATPTAFGVNPRYLPECISGAVSESRIYPRVRMEFSDLCSLRCSWKPVNEAACAE